MVVDDQSHKLIIFFHPHMEMRKIVIEVLIKVDLIEPGRTHGVGHRQLMNLLIMRHLRFLISALSLFLTPAFLLRFILIGLHINIIIIGPIGGISISCLTWVR